MAQGEVIAEYGPWLVVRKADAPPRTKGIFVVVDRSTEPPVKVYGPTTKADAQAYANVNYSILAMVQGQVPGEGRA